MYKSNIVIGNSQLKYSYNCIRALFKTMFPHILITANFKLSRTKMSYISETIGPHFHSMLIRDLKNSDSVLTSKMMNLQIKPSKCN